MARDRLISSRRQAAAIHLVVPSSCSIIKFLRDCGTPCIPGFGVSVSMATIAPNCSCPFRVCRSPFTWPFLTLHVWRSATKPAPADRRVTNARRRPRASARAGFATRAGRWAIPCGFILAALCWSRPATIGAMIGLVVLDFRRLNAQRDQATRALIGSERRVRWHAPMSGARNRRPPLAAALAAYSPLSSSWRWALALFQRWRRDPASIHPSYWPDRSPLNLPGSTAPWPTDAEPAPGHVSVVNVFGSLVRALSF